MQARNAALAVLLAGGVLLAAAGCGPRGRALPETPSDTGRPLTVVSFAVDGVPPSPPDEIQTARTLNQAAHFLAATSPDVLLLQYAHAGMPAATFVTCLAEAGLACPHAEVVASRNTDAALVLLSRYPVVTRRSEASPAYRIGDRQLHIEPGILDVDLVAGPHGLIRVVTGSLKDKVFHVSGQTEMRRNEARIVGRRLRRGVSDAEGNGLLVTMVVNDEPSSAPIREIAAVSGGELTIVRPADAVGDAWTTRDLEEDRYDRTDYVFVNRNLAPRVSDLTRLIDAPALRSVSGHRPLVICLTAPDGEGQTAKDAGPDEGPSR